MSELDLFRNNEISLNICERQLWVFAISIIVTYTCTHISVISLSIPIRIGISFLKCFIFSRLCVHFYLLVRYQVNTINIKKLHVSVYVYFSLLVSYQANTINILQIVARKHINTISNITFCLLLSS